MRTHRNVAIVATLIVLGLWLAAFFHFILPLVSSIGSLLEGVPRG